MDFFSRLFDTADFPRRWDCGSWTPAEGWLHILSDIGIWAAYVAIPCVLVYFALRGRKLPFRRIFLLFGAFILLCGTTHLMEAIIFYRPYYRLAGVIKLATAVVSWATVLALIPIVPRALAMRSPDELEREIAARREAVADLHHANALLESRVAERTAELSLAIAALRDERELLRTTLGSIGDGVIATDVEGRVTFLNPVAEALTGWTAAEAHSLPLGQIFKIVNEKTREPVENPALRSLREGAIVALANHTLLITRDGVERPVDDSASPIRDEAGVLAGSVLVFRDITEKKRAEADLLRAGARAQTVLESISDAVVTMDRDWRITYVNPRAAEILRPLRPDSENPIGRIFWDELPDTRGSVFEANYTRAVRDQVTVAFEAYYQPLNIWVDVRAYPSKDGLSLYFLDVTERKRAEDERARLAAEYDQQRRMYETSLENSPDMQYIFGLDGRFRFGNPALGEVLGKTPAEIAGRSFADLDYPPALAERLNAQIRQAIETRQPVRDETAFEGARGIGQYEYIFKPVLSAEGTVEAVVGSTRDITHRKEAEAAIRRSEERLDFVVRTCGVGIWLNPLPLGELVWNANVKAHFHLPPNAEVKIEDFFAILHPDDREPIRAAVEVAISQRSLFDRIYRTVDPKSGSVKWIRAVGMATYAEDGTPQRFDGLTLDITEPKEAEIALAATARQRDALLELQRAVTAAARDADWIAMLEAAAARVLAVIPQADGAAIEMLDRDPATGRETFLYRAAGGTLEASRGLRVKRSGSLSGRCIDGGQILICDDCERDDRVDREACRAVGLRSMIVVPIKQGASFVGVLKVSSKLASVFGESEAVAAQLAVGVIATGLSGVAEAQALGALHDSEARFRLALDSAELGTWNIDPETNSLTVDSRFCEIFGIEPGDLDYERAAEKIHPDDRERNRAAIAESTRADNPAPYAVEYRVVRPDGSVRWVYAKGRSNLRTGPAGRRAVSFDGTVADITERKRVEADRQIFVTLAENSTDFIGMADPEGVGFYLNRAGRRMIGLDGVSREATGLHIREFFFPEDRDAMFGEFFPRVFAEGHGETEIRFRHFGTGEAIWMLYNVFTLADPKGRLIGHATVSRDITQRRILEGELRQLAADLSAADRRKDEFLATLAHELRNPLAPIRNGLQMMRLSGSGGEAVDQARAMMDRQLTQMVRLVDDLMDVSRITRGKLELRRERLPLAAVIHSAVETSRPLIEQMGHHLAVDLPEPPITVDADLTRLAQVFMNLLNNAAKYTDRGGHIWLTAERQGADVVVSVRDDGIGIDAEQMPHIFDMFSQAALEKSQGGLGIGLTLVKRLVELHDGTIEASSEGHARGSEFRVRLPIAEALEKGAAAVAETPAAGAALRMLVVDDNRDGADSLSMMLELMGHEIFTAYDGEEAVSAAKTFRPDVILMDIGLPKLNGYEACRRIRQQMGGREITIVAQTGWGQDEDRRRSREAGFDHHLVKPVDPAALMALLAGLPAAD